ncbi:MAG TPA: hypothetical protein VGF14_05600 [Alphaproteobacteria bacterium]
MSLAQRIAFFEFVRDIPYRIGLGEDDTNYNCVTKSDMLAKMLEGLGIKSRPIICTFDWMEGVFPASVLALPRDPGETHQYLEIYIPETKKWIKCDPTWDKRLADAGFTIPQWNGKSDTALAVKPHKIYSAEESLQIIADENDPKEYTRHMRKHRRFYKAINRWLESQRR